MKYNRDWTQELGEQQLESILKRIDKEKGIILLSEEHSFYAPETPSGTVLTGLAAKTEQDAWNMLLAEARHMPYKTVSEFKKRGYEVNQWIT